MTQNQIRERVARAICEASEENPDSTGDCRGNAYRWQDYLSPADAALDAVGLGYGKKEIELPNLPWIANVLSHLADEVEAEGLAAGALRHQAKTLQAYIGTNQK